MTAQEQALAELRDAIHSRLAPIQDQLMDLIRLQLTGVADQAEIEAEARRLMAENDRLERELEAEIMAETGPDGVILNVPRLIASICAAARG